MLRDHVLTNWFVCHRVAKYCRICWLRLVLYWAHKVIGDRALELVKVALHISWSLWVRIIRLIHVLDLKLRRLLLWWLRLWMKYPLWFDSFFLACQLFDLGTVSTALRPATFYSPDWPRRIEHVARVIKWHGDDWSWFFAIGRLH